MSKNNTGLYLGLAAFGAGGYYLYRGGGSAKAAKEEAKTDANRVKSNIPRGEKAENLGERVDNARTKAKADERIPEIAQESINKIDEIRQDAAGKLGSGVEKLDKGG
ncbi:hypothetical protein AWENTII_001100 [Aspergillus wentii]